VFFVFGTWTYAHSSAFAYFSRKSPSWDPLSSSGQLPFSRQGYGEALGNKVGGGISLSPLVVSLEDTKAQARP